MKITHFQAEILASSRRSPPTLLASAAHLRVAGNSTRGCVNKLLCELRAWKGFISVTPYRKFITHPRKRQNSRRKHPKSPNNNTHPHLHSQTLRFRTTVCHAHSKHSLKPWEMDLSAQRIPTNSVAAVRMSEYNADSRRVPRIRVSNS